MGGQQHHTPAYDLVHTLKRRGRISGIFVLCCFLKNRTWAMLRKLWHCIGAVESTGSEKRDCFLFEGWKVGAGCSIFPVVLLFLTFPRSLIHLPLDPSTTRLCLLFHPWRRPTVFVCLFLTNPPAFTPSPPHPVLLHIFLSPVVSLSSISWSSRPVQVGARVVLSFSGFTHSRYYHQTPVRLADSHLDRAVNHLADNDGRCPLCQAWCPQMKGLHQAWP